MASILLCRPKGANVGYTAYNKDKAQVQEDFSWDVDEETILHYLKQKLFVAQNVHKLEIQLKSFQFMMELLLVHQSVITKGVHAIMWDFNRYHTLIKEMFKVVDNCAKVCPYPPDQAI